MRAILFLFLPMVALCGCGQTQAAMLEKKMVPAPTQEAAPVVRKRVWFNAPPGMHVVVCNGPAQPILTTDQLLKRLPPNGCAYHSRGEATVVGHARSSDGWDFTTVTMSDSQVRYIRNDYAMYFSDVDPSIKERAEAAECAKRGQPQIGMSIGQAVGTCWGQPKRVNRTQTALGDRQQFAYGGGGYLYFENGRLVTIQTSR